MSAKPKGPKAIIRALLTALEKLEAETVPGPSADAEAKERGALMTAAREYVERKPAKRLAAARAKVKNGLTVEPGQIAIFVAADGKERWHASLTKAGRLEVHATAKATTRAPERVAVVPLAMNAVELMRAS